VPKLTCAEDLTRLLQILNGRHVVVHEALYTMRRQVRATRGGWKLDRVAIRTVLYRPVWTSNLRGNGDGLRNDISPSSGRRQTRVVPRAGPAGRGWIQERAWRSGKGNHRRACRR